MKATTLKQIEKEHASKTLFINKGTSNTLNPVQRTFDVRVTLLG